MENNNKREELEAVDKGRRERTIKRGEERKNDINQGQSYP